MTAIQPLCRPRLSLAMSLVLLATLSALGCRDDEAPEGPTPTDRQEALETVPQVSGPAEDEPPDFGADVIHPEGPNPVVVTLYDYEIEMGDVLPPVTTLFQIVNEGSERHGFRVEGLGLDARLDEPLAPGAEGELRVDLEPGTYIAYCPLDGHADLGMQLQIHVSE